MLIILDLAWIIISMSTNYETMMMMMMTNTLMGLDYISKVRPATALLFIFQAIYERGEPWWNYIHRGKLLTCPPELSGNPTKSSSRKGGGTGKGNYKFCLIKYLCPYFEGIFNML
jgi:hypothetical protein